ncbi:Uncharacterised protein [Citrobacter koseri]|uniref:Uncharacterized protein n=1 Tax=Citrobacter koseri TaxID=545 RepID=A0A447UL85_CITKO|nr:Uncharacterised protein [Citrobacter koseri]
MTDKTIPFSLLDLAPIPKAPLRKRPSHTHWISPVWQSGAAITATGWRNITT